MNNITANQIMRGYAAPTRIEWGSAGTLADREAARRIIGNRPMSDKMRDPRNGMLLSGVEDCFHPITASGHPAYSEGLVEYIERPYYHHGFTRAGVNAGGHDTCFCGNSENHPTHLTCWDACDDCGRFDGSHNPDVEH